MMLRHLWSYMVRSVTDVIFLYYVVSHCVILCYVIVCSHAYILTHMQYLHMYIMYVCMDGWMDGRTDGLMDARMYVCGGQTECLSARGLAGGCNSSIPAQAFGSMTLRLCELG